VLVLAGDSSGHRILKGAELVRQGFAPKVIVSGPMYYGAHECEPAIALAERAGYPASYFVHFEHDANSTEEEARAVGPMLRSLGAGQVLLVTSDFHTRRAGRCFARRYRTSRSMWSPPPMRTLRRRAGGMIGRAENIRLRMDEDGGDLARDVRGAAGKALAVNKRN